MYAVTKKSHFQAITSGSGTCPQYDILWGKPGRKLHMLYDPDLVLEYKYMQKKV